MVGISGGDRLVRGAWRCASGLRPRARGGAHAAGEGLRPRISERLARELAAHYGVAPVLENITPVLDGFGCYARRDEAIRRVFPEYDAAAGYKAKIVLPPEPAGRGHAQRLLR